MMGRTCKTNGEKRNAYNILMGKPEGKRPLRRPRCRLVKNNKMELREIEWVVWTGLMWLRIKKSGGRSTFIIINHPTLVK
jgi:hypothetical protein